MTTLEVLADTAAESGEMMSDNKVDNGVRASRTAIDPELHQPRIISAFRAPVNFSILTIRILRIRIAGEARFRTIICSSPSITTRSFLNELTLSPNETSDPLDASLKT